MSIWSGAIGIEVGCSIKLSSVISLYFSAALPYLISIKLKKSLGIYFSCVIFPTFGHSKQH